MLSRKCIGQLYTISLLLSVILGMVSETFIKQDALNHVRQSQPYFH